MSLLSEPAIFVMKNETKATTPPKVEQVIIHDASPIIGLYSSEATADKIVLNWPINSDARSYEIYWDHGNPSLELEKFIILGVTNKTLTFTVDHTSSGGILGSEFLL